MYQHLDTSFPGLVELACPLPWGEFFLSSILPEIRYLGLSVHYHKDDVNNDEGLDATNLTLNALANIRFTSFPKLKQLTLWGPTESHRKVCTERGLTLGLGCQLIGLRARASPAKLLVREVDDRASKEWWSNE
jgi:hypothetical protein